MNLAEKKIAVLAEELYEDLELWYPVLRFREAGASVTIVGPKHETTYRSKNGYPATTDAAATQVSAKDFDAVIVPGGYAPDRMRRHAAMIDLVRDAAQSGKVVAAICHAGWMLVSAGVVKGKNVTSFFAIRDDMENAGAVWHDREVVVDGRLVTSRVPSDLPAFCKAIGDLLA